MAKMYLFQTSVMCKFGYTNNSMHLALEVFELNHTVERFISLWGNDSPRVLQE